MDPRSISSLCLRAEAAPLVEDGYVGEVRALVAVVNPAVETGGDDIGDPKDVCSNGDMLASSVCSPIGGGGWSSWLLLLDDVIPGANVNGAGTRLTAPSTPAAAALNALSTDDVVAELSNLSLIGLTLSILGLPSVGTGGGTPKPMLNALALENRDIFEAMDIREYR